MASEQKCVCPALGPELVSSFPHLVVLLSGILDSLLVFLSVLYTAPPPPTVPSVYLLQHQIPNKLFMYSVFISS